MVDAIKTTVNRLELAKGRTAEGRPAGNGSPVSDASPSADSAKVSDIASSKAHMQLAEAPSFDAEAVRRIKDAIARGAYPIDVDRISEALMDAYREMKT